MTKTMIDLTNALCTLYRVKKKARFNTARTFFPFDYISNEERVDERFDETRVGLIARGLEARDGGKSEGDSGNHHCQLAPLSLRL